jgi:hypothetical protein
MTDWFRKSEDFDLALPMKLPILNFRVKLSGSDAEQAAANKALVDEVTRDGKLWISHTYVNGKSVCRMMIISYFTDEKNLAELKATLVKAASRTTSTR